MKCLFSILVVFILCIEGLQAADKPATAFEVIKQSQRQLGDRFKKTLISMESKHAKLRPRYWWVRFYDDQALFKVRAIQVIGPEIIRNLEPGNPFDGGNVEYVIQPEQLKVDSEKCIVFMEKAAKESNIPLYSLDVLLNKPHPGPGETNPVWTFDWFDEKNGHLGKMSVSATTGKVTEIVGLKIKAKRFQDVSKTTFSQDVEDTFLDIGADLEEFFTGERTIKSEDESSPKKDSPSEK